jgi:hypothetical protein
MADGRLTLIDDGRVVEVPAHFSGDRARLRPADVETALGWELKPAGLCQGGVCIPVRDATDLVNHDGVDLAGLAHALDRPLALDVDERSAYLGAAAAQRAAQLASLQAPEFTLPDLSGRMHSLSDYRGNKVLLIAYASW